LTGGTTLKPLLLLVDGHSLAFRSFYAFSKGGEGGLSTKEGIPTSVTYGFLKALLDNCKGLAPQGVVIAFDTAEPTFRHEADEAYKAHRDAAPEHFFQDLGNLQQILQQALDIPLCMAPGYEADDVLGTLANRAANDGWRVRILSGDRDLFQLVDDERDIAVLYMGGGPYAKSSGPLEIRRDGVVAKLGVTPEEVVDLKALTGDSSDNIPGVKGVGPKTAITLLNAHGDLDGIYAALEQLEAAGPKAKDPKGALKGALLGKLSSDRENAYRSRMLAEILVDIPLPSDPRLPLGSVNSDSLAESLEELELFSLRRQVNSFATVFSSEPPTPAAEPAAKAEVPTEPEASEETASETPALEPQLITSPEALEALVQRLLACNDPLNPVAVDTETTSLNPFQAELVGLGVCWGPGLSDLAYIPLGHQAELSDPPQLPLDQVLGALAPWLGSSAHPKTLQNAKYDRLILLRHGLPLAGVVMDTLLADYVRDANAKHGLELLAQRNFGFLPTSYSELVPKGANFSAVPMAQAALYCGMDVHVTYRLTPLLRGQLEALGDALPTLLDQVELPLEPVLAQMEATGIRIDTDYLGELSRELKATLERLETEAKEAAGTEFNLASPKQLGELLFDTLGLDRKKSRKTKTGWSTDATVLEKLEDAHPVVPLVLEHRTLSKLKSTYVDALPALMEPETGRVHTDFNQAVTATGRLSSSNPNLQNIPIKSERGLKLRSAFIAGEGFETLLTADYSQIEMRIMAHLSEDEGLIEAFRAGEDLHNFVGARIYDVKPTEVTAQMRSKVKAMSYGLVYGLSEYGLARQLKISKTEAKELMGDYFARFGGVKRYLDTVVQRAKSLGYTQTIYGRRRNFEDLNSKIFQVRENARRAALNAPIQGTAADIMKLAMIDVRSQMRSEGLRSQLLLQVHDELVFAVYPGELEKLKALATKAMSLVATLSVPLEVHIGIGENWELAGH